MKKTNNNIWKMLFVIACIIILILVIVIIKNKDNSNGTNSSSSSSSQESSAIKRSNIRLSEDLSLMREIKGLGESKKVMCNDARIELSNGKAEVYLTLTNESEKETVENQKFEVSLIDKNNKVIDSKEVTVDKIDSNYGYADINMSFDVPEIQIIYNVQVTAK